MTGWRRTAVMLLALLTVSACAAGSIRDGTYRDSHDRFTVRVPPPRWQLESLDGAALVFRNPELDAGISLRVDCDQPESGPLRWVAQHLFFGLSDKEIDQRAPVTLSGVPGIRTRMHARLDHQPVEVDGVTLRREECLYDFAYVAPPERFEEGRPDFDAFVQSWATLTTP